MTSNTKGDSLPLTSFKVEAKPCLDHNDVSKAPNAEFYPLENDRKIEDCREIAQFSERYDSRYLDLGLKISEYDVQKESDVLATLEDLPNYSLYVTDSIEQNIMYGFWSRAAIPWDLECEETHSRDKVVAAANEEKQKESLNEVVIIVLSAIAYGVGFLFTLSITGVFICGKFSEKVISEPKTKVGLGCCMGVQLILFIITIVLVFGQKEELVERDEALTQLSFVNECGDKYTKIPDYFLPEIE